VEQSRGPMDKNRIRGLTDRRYMALDNPTLPRMVDAAGQRTRFVIQCSLKLEPQAKQPVRRRPSPPSNTSGAAVELESTRKTIPECARAPTPSSGCTCRVGRRARRDTRDRRTRSMRKCSPSRQRENAEDHRPIQSFCSSAAPTARPAARLASASYVSAICSITKRPPSSVS
jgi:hypothetical protein